MANREEIILEVKTKFEELKELRNALTVLKKSLSKEGLKPSSIFKDVSKESKEASIKVDNLRRIISNIKPGTNLDSIKNRINEIGNTISNMVTRAKKEIISLERLANDAAILERKGDKKSSKKASVLREQNETMSLTGVPAPSIYKELQTEALKINKELSKQQKEYKKTLSTLDNLTNRPVAKDIVSGKDTVGEFVTNLKGNVSHAKEAVVELKKVLSTDLPSAIKNPLEKELKKYENITSGKKTRQGSGLEYSKLTSSYLPSMTRIEGNLVSSTIPEKISSEYKKYYSNLEKENQNLVKSFDYAAWRDETNKTINFNKDKLNQLKESLKSVNKEGGANVKELASKIKSEISATNNVLAGHTKGWKAMADSIIGNTANMIKMQAQWYTAKALVFMPVEQISKGAKAFVEWQQSITDVKAASNATAIEMEKIKKASLEIGTTTPVSTEKAAKAMFEFAQAGMAATAMQEASLVAAKLVTITHEDMGDAVTALTKIYNVWKVDSQDMIGVGDKLAASLADSRLKVKDLSTIFNYLAQTGGLAKISLTDILTLSTALSKAGAEPSTIGTGLSNLISRLLNPEQFRKLTKAFGPKLKEAGMSFKDITLTADNDILTIVKNFEKAGFTAKDFMSGLELRTGRAASGLSLLSGEIDKIKANIESKGKMQLMFDISMEGIENKLKLIDNNFKNIFIRLGDYSTGFVASILDEFNQVVLALNVLVGKTSDVEKEFKKLNNTGKITFEIFNTVKSIFGGIAIIFSPIIEGLTALTKNLGYAGDGVSLLTKLITTGLIAALLNKIKWVTTSITLFTSFGSLFTGASGLTAVISGFTKVLSKLWGLASTKIFSVLIFFEVANWINDYNKKDLKKLQESSEEGLPLSTKKGKAYREGNIKALKEAISLDEKMAADYRSGKIDIPNANENTNLNISKRIAAPYYFENIAKTHDVGAKTKRQQLKEEEEKLDNILKEEVEAKKTKKESSTPSAKGKQKLGMGKEWALEKEEAQTNLKIIDNLEAEAFSELEKKRKFGITNEEDYYSKRIELIKSFEKDRNIVEDNLLKFHKEELKAAMQEDLSKENLTERQKDQIRKSYANKEASIIADNVKNRRISLEKINKAEEELSEYRRERILKDYNFEIEKTLSLEKQKLEIERNTINRQTELRKWMYDKNLISAKDYYAKEEQILKDDLNIKIKSINLEKDSKLSIQNKIINTPNIEVKKIEDAELEKRKIILSSDLEIVKAKEENSDKIQKLELEKTDSIKYLWTGEDGVIKTTQKALVDLLNSWKTFGEQWFDMIKGVFQAATTTISDTFFDAMEGKLDSVEDYWESFASSVKRILANMFTQDMMQMLFGMSAQTGQFTGGGVFGSLLGALGLSAKTTTSDGIVGGSEATYSLTPTAHSGGLIKYHNGGTIGLKRMHIGGLMPDERLIVGQTGEGVVSRSGMKTLEQINNGSLSSGRSTPPVINNFNIQTMDAQSFAQFAYNNKNIFAAAIQASNSNNGSFRRGNK